MRYLFACVVNVGQGVSEQGNTTQSSIECKLYGKDRHLLQPTLYMYMKFPELKSCIHIIYYGSYPKTVATNRP